MTGNPTAPVKVLAFLDGRIGHTISMKLNNEASGIYVTFDDFVSDSFYVGYSYILR